MKRDMFRRALALLLVAALLAAAGCSPAKEPQGSEPAESPAESAQEPSGGESGGAWTDALDGDAPELPEGELELPEDNRRFDADFARRALALCSGHTAENERALLEEAGFEVLAQINFDKADDDPAHTCAYTIGRKLIKYNNEERTLIIVAIRGTNAGEWYSNFDFAESHSDDAVFAENFLFAAEDVLLGVGEVLKTQRSPLVLVCGHSRGGACANLLALLLNAQLGADNVCAYTFASPNTVCGGDPGIDCSNIFNVINLGDLVPRVPLAGWGYCRPGIDIILESDERSTARAGEIYDVFYGVAPTISGYYNDRHSLTQAGLSEDGATVFELMLLFVRTLAGASLDGAAGGGVELGAFSGESDLAPLFNLLEDETKNGGEGAARLLKQHMPATYQKLLAQYGERGE